MGKVSIMNEALIRIVDSLGKIRAGYLPDTCLQCYSYIILLSDSHKITYRKLVAVKLRITEKGIVNII
jgi:hypothetical protein